VRKAFSTQLFSAIPSVARDPYHLAVIKDEISSENLRSCPGSPYANVGRHSDRDLQRVEEDRDPSLALGISEVG